MILLPLVLPVALVGGGISLAVEGGHPVWGVFFVLVGLLAGYVCYPILFGRASTRPQDTTAHFEPSECPQQGKYPDVLSSYNVRRVPVEYAAVYMFPATVTKVEYRAKCTLCGLDQVVPGPKTPHPGPSSIQDL